MANMFKLNKKMSRLSKKKDLNKYGKYVEKMALKGKLEYITRERVKEEWP